MDNTINNNLVTINKDSAQPSRTKPAEERRADLMTAAQTLFLAQGVKATTIDEIAKLANVAKGTFYIYFKSKVEMIKALAQQYTDDYLQALELAVNACEPDDWNGRLSAWIQTAVNTYFKTYELHDMVYINHHHHDRDNVEKNAILTQLKDILAEGERVGVWQVDDLHVLAVFIFSSVHGVVDDAIANGAAEGCDIEKEAQVLGEKLKSIYMKFLTTS